jgi:hypothetical protein
MISFNRNNEPFLLPLETNNITDIFKTEIESNTNLMNDYTNISIELKDNKYFPFFDDNKKEKNNSLNEEEKYESEENQLYFIDNFKKPLKIFKNKKRGREKKKDTTKIHDKYRIDNILTKIQVHYLSFIISFINDILKNLHFKQRFLDLDYKYKRNIKKNFAISLKTKNIKDIICNKITSKFKKDENSNSSIYNEIKENKVLNKLLSENYLLLFKKIYYRSSKIVNLREYGLDKDIILSSDVKMFEDLLKDIDCLDVNKEYKKKIIQCVNNNYFPSLLFKIE